MTAHRATLSFSVTTKGKRVLLYEGYIYTLNRDRGKVKYWRCEDRTCSAFVHTDENDCYKTHSGSHDRHLPSPERVELLEFKRKVKDRVIKETTAIARIYDQELAAANLSQIALALAPAAKDSRKCLLSTVNFRFHVIVYLEPSLSRLRRGTTPVLSTSSAFDIPDN